MNQTNNMNETKTEKLIPFDLEVALKHPERVRHRDGLESDQIVHFKNTAPNYRVAIHWKGTTSIGTYTEDGRSDFACDPCIFLTAPEPKLVPWSHVDEVPDAWFRHNGSQRIYHFDAIYPTENTVGSSCGVRISLSDLFNHYEYHYHRGHKGPWNVCGKESAE